MHGWHTLMDTPILRTRAGRAISGDFLSRANTKSPRSVTSNEIRTVGFMFVARSAIGQLILPPELLKPQLVKSISPIKF